MKSRIALAWMCCFLGTTMSFGQTPAPPPTPTETTAPDIPGVVAGGTTVALMAQGLRGTEGPIPLPDGSLLFTEQTAQVITKIDANGQRSTYVEKTDGANGLTFDPKGRLIGTRPSTHAIAVFLPSVMVLTDSAEGLPLMGPNDLIADKKGGIKPDGSVIKIADDVTRPNGVSMSQA